MYRCEDGEVTLKQRNEYYNKIENKLTKSERDQWDEASNPDNYYYYDYDDYYYDYYDSYNWDERNDPCKPSYYRDKQKSTFVLSSNIGITAKKE